MIGAILGDVIGSPFEFHNHKSKDFDLFSKDCRATDDSIMTMAVAKAIYECHGDYSDLDERAVDAMREFGNKMPYAGYGARFAQWLTAEKSHPYNSYGNGAAMRISPVGFAASSIEECKMMSRKVTAITHNHRQGIKGAEAIATCIWLLKHGASKHEINLYVNRHYYKLNFSLNEIREKYFFHASCQETCPQAIVAFLESKDFEDAIRCAVSVGGDSDTICAITGALAEAYYGLPNSSAKDADDSFHFSNAAYTNDSISFRLAEKYCPAEMICYVEALEALHNGYGNDKLFMFSAETEKLLENEQTIKHRITL